MASAVYTEPPASRLSISLEGEASASPFPSPSSSFLPPPTPGAHEFAVKPAPTRIVRKSSASAHSSASTSAPTMSAPHEGEAATNGETAAQTEPKSPRSSVNGSTLHPKPSIPNGTLDLPPSTLTNSKESLNPVPLSPLFSSPTTPTPYSFQHQPQPPQPQGQDHLAPMEFHHLEPPRSPVVDQSTSSSTTPTILTSALPPQDADVPCTPDAKKTTAPKESPPPSKIIIPDTLLDVGFSSSAATPGSVPASPAFSTFSRSSGRSRPISASVDPSLFSSRAAPPSPAMSRRVSGAPSLAASTRSRPSRPPSVAVSRTNSQRKSTASGARSVMGSPVINPHRQSVGSQLGQSFIPPLPSPRELTFSSLAVPSSSTATTTTTITGGASGSGSPAVGSPTISLSGPSSSAAAQKHVSVVLTPPQRTTFIKIRDFGFPASDERHSGLGPDVPKPNKVGRMNRRLGGRALSTGSMESSDGDGGFEDEDEDEDENGWGGSHSYTGKGPGDGGGGWGTFFMGQGRLTAAGAGAAAPTANGTAGVNGVADAEDADGAFPSRMDLDRNFLEGSSEEGDLENDGDDQEYFDAPEDEEDEDTLYPGLYRALYAFEPEGTAEMRLDEDQIVRVVGRGGGVGWAVVIDEAATAAAAQEDGADKDGAAVPKHALVPESYLEPVRLDWEDDEAELAAAAIGEVVAA